MKKIISLLLCLVMVAMTLASCSGDAGTTTGEVDRPNRTLKIAVVVSDKTTDEGIASMEKAFNALSSVALTTKADFVCFKASEYEDKIEAEMERLEAGGELADIEEENDKANGTASGAQVDAEGDPIPASKQFDIVLVTSEEMYVKFVEKGWIVSLQTHLDGIYQKLKTKVVDKAMEYTLIDGKCYAIPAATAYGSYTYLSVNKKVADFYNMNKSDFVDVNSAYQLFKMMENAPAGEGLDKWQNEYTSFSPVLNKADDFVYSNVKYFSDDGGFSLIGATHKPNANLGSWYNADCTLNLLEDAAYRTYLTMKFDFDKKGYFGNGDAEDYIVGLVEGDYSLRNSDPENYYYIPVTKPQVEREEVFSAMLAVSSFSVDTKRSVEIIQELMTNDTKNGLLNIILYGEENANYYLDNGVVKLRESHSYAAHPDYLFGNLNETAHPCSNYGQKADTYSDGLLQNLDLPDSQIPVLFAREDVVKSFYAFERPAGWEEWKIGDEIPAGAKEVPAAVLRAINWAATSEYSESVLDALMDSTDLDSFIAAYDAQLEAMNDPVNDPTVKKEPGDPEGDANIINFNAVKGKNISSKEMDTITYAIADYYQRMTNK